MSNQCVINPKRNVSALTAAINALFINLRVSLDQLQESERKQWLEVIKKGIESLERK